MAESLAASLTLGGYSCASYLLRLIGDAASPCTLISSKQAIGVSPFYFAGVAIINGSMPMILSSVEIISGPVHCKCQ
jgi:hypothetical protein